jgi:RNase P/RNase MRP subunit p30
MRFKPHTHARTKKAMRKAKKKNYASEEMRTTQPVEAKWGHHLLFSTKNSITLDVRWPRKLFQFFNL